MRDSGDAELRTEGKLNDGGRVIECEQFFEEEEEARVKQQDKKILEEDAASDGLHAGSP